MTLSPRLRRFVLTAHVTLSVGWLGGVAAFLALAVSGLAARDEAMVRADYLAMALVGWYIIVPFSLGSLLTGLTHSLATEWGLFRHYWVLVKLVLTIAVIALLLLHMQLVGALATAAAAADLSGDLRGLQIQIAGDAGAAVLVLLGATALSIYKPRGVTRRGRRAHPSC